MALRISADFVAENQIPGQFFIGCSIRIPNVSIIVRFFFYAIVRFCFFGAQFRFVFFFFDSPKNTPYARARLRARRGSWILFFGLSFQE
ncbi:hypothetical protein ES705_22732 [subsurface metagenome]